MGSRNPPESAIEISHCGVCHSDLHTARNEWSGTVYPCVPGHEIIGRVSAVGKYVKRFKSGDLAAVGGMVDACRTCESCKLGLEQYCERGMVQTYNSPDPHTGKRTYGGYSEAIVVDEAFTLHVPAGLDPAAAAPLLCADITTYSPLKHWKDHNLATQSRRLLAPRCTRSRGVHAAEPNGQAQTQLRLPARYRLG